MGQTTSGESLSSGVAGQGDARTAVQQKDDGVTWWCRILAKSACVVAGFGKASMYYITIQFVSDVKTSHNGTFENQEH